MRSALRRYMPHGSYQTSVVCHTALPCLMCWLAAKAAPSGPLALRVLDARSEPDGSRANPRGLRSATAAKPACAGYLGTDAQQRCRKRNIHYEKLYVVVLLDDSC